ncbi:MAG: hypothetical protein NUW37_14965 [Planctomycetes bacterium]|nr:hypothetical protein [Planctomycetota bacterium]
MPRWKKNKSVRAQQKEQARLREELELEARKEFQHIDELASLVIARDRGSEPFHRLFPYRQGFSPELVRVFLNQAQPASGTILDPFSGGGTTAIECAREGAPALGFDVVPALLFIASSLFEDEIPALPDDLADTSFRNLCLRLKHPAHVAMALCCAARTVTGEGREKQADSSPLEMLRAQMAMLFEDRSRERLRGGFFVQADARELPLADGCVGGILTSPPYIAKYDYEVVTKKISALYADLGGGRSGFQIAGGKRLKAPPPRRKCHEAAEEAIAELAGKSGAKGSGMIRAYFLDVERMIAECARVLADEAPMWMVIAGADVCGVYIPSDLIAKDIAITRGLHLEALCHVRHLRHSGKILGSIENAAPRESLICLRK